MSNSMSNWKSNGSRCYKRSSSNYGSSSWGNKGSSSRKVKAGVKEQLRISLSITLMKTV